ncbi:MAG TPA: extracellular solute-binding protein, partial [Kiloniellaceae bacterium]|nr:extracellular solute-binding protein [Kiloniellaceae bacterium]
MAKLLNLAAGAALAALATTGSALAETVTLEVVHAWGGHKRFHEPIAEAFMKQHPEIEIKYRAPMKSYTDGHQTILRQALSDDLPDIWYSPYNTLGELVAALEQRGQITDLEPMMKAEGDAWVEANYAPNVLTLGQVDGRQWGVPFNASTPIVYYNLDLIEEAGGDLNKLPGDWDGLITLGAKVSKLGDDVDGLAYSVSEWGDDWLWQALVFNFGGKLMDDQKTRVTFGDDAGVQAVKLVDRIARETGMPLLTEDQTIQQFSAGKLGIFIGSTAEVRVMGELVGDKFAWKTGGYPIADQAKGGVPTGGN